MANEVRTSPFVSEQTTSRPKRIIVCCDGTWQSSISLDPKRGTESNVARIARVSAKAGTDEQGRAWEQVVYYDAGIGTGNLGLVEKYTQGGLGVGLNENVVEAYNFIVNNYKQGDQLYFFGFSRGAYTVRAAAGLVGQIGIIQPAYMKDFVSSYAQYRNTKSGRPGFDKYKPWMDFADSNPQYLVEDRRNVVVQVIGVWDTVGALGIPELGHFWTIRKADTKYYEFYDTNLSPCIKHAFQALALDERRPAFDPTIWRLKNNNTTQLAQCWFPGAHINIGGGNNEPSKGKDDREQLASISYAWMLDRVRPYLAFDTTSLEAQFEPLDKLSDTLIPPPQKEGWGSWLKKILPTGYARGTIDDSYSGFFRLLTFARPRTPNRYYDDEVTNEYVHPSVHYRQYAQQLLEERPYVPAALKGWVRIFDQNGQDANGRLKRGWKWVKYIKSNPQRGVENWLWEYEIGGMQKSMSLEKRLINNSWVDAVHKEVEASWKEGRT